MLSIMASKKKDKYIYFMKWIDPEDPFKSQVFKFALVQDDDLYETDFNKLSGNEGTMVIKTKSMINFQPDHKLVWLGAGKGQKYSITKVSGDHKENGELAYARFLNNGNLDTYLTVRRGG